MTKKKDGKDYVEIAGMKMPKDEMRCRVHKVMGDVLAEHEAEEKRKRIAQMPDVLDQYDKLYGQFKRIAVLVEFLASQMRAREPQRVEDAVYFLASEVRAAEAEHRDYAQVPDRKRGRRKGSQS